VACARGVKARKIDAGRVFDAPIFRARGRGSLLKNPKSQSLHWAMLKRLALDHYVCANYSKPYSDLVYVVRRFAALIELHVNGYCHTVRALARAWAAQKLSSSWLPAVPVKLRRREPANRPATGVVFSAFLATTRMSKNGASSLPPRRVRPRTDALPMTGDCRN